MSAHSAANAVWTYATRTTTAGTAATPITGAEFTADAIWQYATRELTAASGVDALQKRYSSMARRRLPWFRRFTLPLPDGTIGAADRQQVLGIYAGVLAGGEVVVTYARSCTVTAFSRQTIPATSKQSKPATSRQSVPDTECCQ